MNTFFIHTLPNGRDLVKNQQPERSQPLKSQSERMRLERLIRLYRSLFMRVLLLGRVYSSWQRASLRWPLNGPRRALPKLTNWNEKLRIFYRGFTAKRNSSDQVYVHCACCDDQACQPISISSWFWELQLVELERQLQVHAFWCFSVPRLIPFLALLLAVALAAQSFGAFDGFLATVIYLGVFVFVLFGADLYNRYL